MATKLTRAEEEAKARIWESAVPAPSPVPRYVVFESRLMESADEVTVVLVPRRMKRRR